MLKVKATSVITGQNWVLKNLKVAGNNFKIKILYICLDPFNLLENQLWNTVN